MWAIAYMRGNFFARFRTTLRCESLHGKLGKFVEPHDNLTMFIPHFQHCVKFLHNSEDDAKLNSLYGHPIM